VRKPTITHRIVDWVRRMPHAQARVASFFEIGRRPAPILSEKHRESPLSRPEIVWLRIQGEQHGVAAHTAVKLGSEAIEELLPTDSFVDRQRGCLVA
jgi:hypothetical protein